VFVSFEGLDGSGKSTQAELLRERLERAGRQVVATREPGGTPVGEAVRELLLQGADMTAWAEATLFAAARAELVERVVRPALDRGADVVCDRYLDSSLAYQGVARGLGIDEVLELNLRATGGLLPDRTILLLVEPEVGIARLGAARDRIEREGLEFLQLVDRGYRELADRFPERIVPLDGARPADEIAEQVAASVGERAGVS
jgi:dTMP kinase